jgi:hypothetical protein
MTQSDKEFIQENIINFESVRIGFLRNIPIHILNRYEQLYRSYLDPNFILTAWCSACVMDMMKRLVMYWDYINEEPIVEEVTETIEKKKRGRPFKK